MNFSQATGLLGDSVDYMKNITKEVLRGVVPAHRRFSRAGESFLAAGEREVHELHRLVNNGTTAVDVGANVGDYTYALCRHVGPTGGVIAVEPIPDLARMLSRATKRLGLPVKVFNCALSSRDGNAQLFIPVRNGKRLAGFATLERRMVAGFSRRVILRRLDDLCRDVRGRISFLKIDVEGHELEVLRGGVETLRLHRPNLLVEIEQRHSPVPIFHTFDFLASFGYAGEFLDESGARKALSCFDIVEHQTRRLGAVGTPAYVSNFIFQYRPGFQK